MILLEHVPREGMAFRCFDYLPQDLARDEVNETVTDRVKIAFSLTRDSDGYPPADWEHLWAIRRGENEYELDNVPFFAKGVSSGDLVSVTSDQDQLKFGMVLKYGGHSTLRVIVFDSSQKESIRSDLAKLGCETEGSHLPDLFAVDVPPNVELASVIGYLVNKAEEDTLDYEESAVRY